MYNRNYKIFIDEDRPLQCTECGKFLNKPQFQNGNWTPDELCPECEETFWKVKGLGGETPERIRQRIKERKEAEANPPKHEKKPSMTPETWEVKFGGAGDKARRERPEGFWKWLMSQPYEKEVTKTDEKEE